MFQPLKAPSALRKKTSAVDSTLFGVVVPALPIESHLVPTNEFSLLSTAYLACAGRPFLNPL